MKDISGNKFDLMGKLSNDITDLIDKSQLTPTEVLTVFETLKSYIVNLLLTKTNASRR